MNQNRIDRVLAKMNEQGLDCFFICDIQSIHYLTDLIVYPGERLWALCLRADGRHVFFANRLFGEIKADYPVISMDDTDDITTIVAKELSDSKVMGVDKTLAARWLLPLMQKNPDCRYLLGSDCVDDVRACKDEEEKAIMREASRINDECIVLLAEHLYEGITEREAADYLTKLYAERGSSASFGLIVSFGPNGADPHHVCDDTPLRPGDAIVIDVGCLYKGYCSDMTRTYFYKYASEENVEVYNTVLRAQEAAEKFVKAGELLCDIDATARNIIADKGYGEYFTHRLGHFIGREVHEQGDVSASFKKPAVAGNVFSIEPGIYLPGKFGVRIEDLVIVTEDGCEILNHVSKELTILQ